MPTRGPIVIAEDDQDDCLILQEIFDSLGVKNEIKFFENGNQVLSYLNDTADRPFMIISDINMPVMNGMELKNRINESETLRKKSIPFIFLTNSDNWMDVQKGYDLMVQGYFRKEHSLEKISTMIKKIVDYWSVSKHPNSDVYAA